MASLRAIILALLASRVLAAKTNCPANLDVCGWSLTGTYGYTQDDLVAAAADGGVGISQAYDSIYNCLDDGEIGFSVLCGAGSCNAGLDGRTSAACKGDVAAVPEEGTGEDEGDAGDVGDDGAGDEDAGDDSGDGEEGVEAATPTADAPLTTLVTTVIGRPTH